MWYFMPPHTSMCRLWKFPPMEAIKNNVIETFNVATLAQYHNVKNFTMISTDEAVNPTNAWARPNAAVR